MAFKPSLQRVVILALVLIVPASSGAADPGPNLGCPEMPAAFPPQKPEEKPYPSPNPTPPPPQACPLFRLDTYAGRGTYGADIWNGKAPGLGKLPSCAQDILNDAYATCLSYTADGLKDIFGHGLPYPPVPKGYADDCAMGGLFQRLKDPNWRPKLDPPNKNSSYPVLTIPWNSLTDVIIQTANDTAAQQEDFKRGLGDAPPYGVFSVLLDNQCRSRPMASGVPAACSDQLFLFMSPISLYWEASSKDDTTTSIVSFPIDPTRDDEWVTWKGSEKMPLVVYDPMHKGRITSADQLFGNWTFGGQRVAALAGFDVPIPWKNGFEALATQDANGDGEISGEELRPLGLWFDKNRNGISEDGEVKSADEAGLKRLFFSPDDKDPSGDIHASRGFEREQDGRRIQRGSVDWFSMPASARGSVFTEPVGAPLKNPDAGDQPSGSSATLPPGTDIGLWQWRLEGASEKNVKIAGYLMLSERQRGKLHGFSLVQVAGDELGAKGKSFLSVYSLAGDVRSPASMRREIEFVLPESGDGKSTTKAILELDSGKAYGKTSVQTANGLVNYSWIGNRVK